MQDRKRVRLCGQTFRTTEKRIARKGLREIFADNRQAICRDETAARSKNEKRKIRRFPPNITLLTKKINVRILTKQVLARIRALRIIAFRSVTEGYNSKIKLVKHYKIIAFRSVTEGYNQFFCAWELRIIIAFRSVTEGYNRPRAEAWR